MFQQSPLEFTPDAFTLRDLLDSDQEKVLQLRMVDGDAWTGLFQGLSCAGKDRSPQ